MPIEGVAFGSQVATATTGIFYIDALPMQGVLRHVSVGDLNNSVTIDYVILEKDAQGRNPVLISNEDLLQNEAVGWNGELPFKGTWKIKVSYSNATIGDNLAATALIEV